MKGFAMTLHKLWKTPAESPVRLRAPVVTLFVLALSLLYDHTGMFRWGILCALLHECGHLAVWGVLVRRPPRLEISAAGICLCVRGMALPPHQERMLAAAGPLTNFLLCAAGVCFMEWQGYTYGGYWFVSANLLLGIFNLLPLPGLDGARLLGSI